MTYQQAAQTSLDVQDACNLSGVARSFVQVIDAVRAESDRIGKGTDWVNRHPIVSLFLDKMASLNQTQCLCSANIGSFSKTYAEVHQIAEQAEPVHSN
jgi:hypothetical protein